MFGFMVRRMMPKRRRVCAKASPTRARISAFIAVAVFGLALCAGHADAQEVYNSTSRLDIISEEVAGPNSLMRWLASNVRAADAVP
jgi:hypothetical protein